MIFSNFSNINQDYYKKIQEIFLKIEIIQY